MVELNHINAVIRDRTLFQAEKLEFKEGDLIALIGKNGSGKSTLLKTISGFDTPVQGTISINKKEYSLQKNYYPSAWVSYIPVKLSPFGSISLLDFILSGKSADRNFLDIPSEKEQIEVIELLKQFKMEAMIHDPFELLSDGEQKLALILRSVYRNSQFLLLDEPESFLDVGNRKRIFEWLKELSNQGKTILFSTHQPELAAAYVKSFLCIDNQKIELKPVEKIDKSFGFLY